MDYRQIGAAILGLVPKIDNPIECHLIDHYFYGDGQPFYMTSDETTRYQQNPLTSEFNYAIGSANPDPVTGSIDVYDFNWGNRPLGPEIATRLGGLVGDLFEGKEFEVYPSDAMWRR